MKRKLIYAAAAILLAPVVLAIFIVPLALFDYYLLPFELGFLFWFIVFSAVILRSPRVRYFVTGE